MSKIIIYHSRCPDGVASVFIMKRMQEFRDAIIHGANERDFSRDMYCPPIRGKDVYMVDFVYNVGMELIAANAKSLHILDHHTTTPKVIENLHIPSQNIHISMNKCAAQIVWDLFHCEEPYPWWLVHIYERDLWIDGPNTTEFSFALVAMGVSYQTFAIINNYSSEEIQHMYDIGKRLLAEFWNGVGAEAIARTRPIQINGHKGCILELSEHISDIGSHLCVKMGYEFSMMWWRKRDGDYVVSIRKKKDNDLVNILDIAMKYGGGGHPAACAFTCNDIDSLADC